MKSGVIYIELDKMLKSKKRSLYWLSANAGVPYPTLWKLVKKESQRSIKLEVLSRICSALDCSRGDILSYEKKKEDTEIRKLLKKREKKKEKKRRRRKARLKLFFNYIIFRY